MLGTTTTTPHSNIVVRIVVTLSPCFAQTAVPCNPCPGVGLHHQQRAVPVKCRELGEGHIFGMPSKHEAGSVSSLLKGDYSPEQLQDDADLGKSVKEGWRNLGPAGRVKA